MFKITATDGGARCGELTTAHGVVKTPVFMPVGTHATVKSLHPQEVRDAGAQIILCNAYHLSLRPGVEIVEKMGGLHNFMKWDGPILTDSGGYQLVSLSDVASVDDEGATFISPYDGSRLRVTPEFAIEIEYRLGADIIMCLDHPVAWDADHGLIDAATARTHAWAKRCRAVHPGNGRLLFGIVQGGFNKSLREQSAGVISSLDFDGIAIGGLSVGEPLDVMEEMTAFTVDFLPQEKPRYFMGLGTDTELLTMISLGVDMFDCVVPTRLARHATAMTAHGKLQLRGAAMATDPRPIDPQCDCACCREFSRAYLRHLFGAQEILAHRLVSIHNITHLTRLMAQARIAIAEGRFGEMVAGARARAPSAELSPAP